MRIGASVARVLERWVDGLTPDPELTVREWAERYRTMSGKGSASQGRWRTDVAPFLGEVMDVLSLYSPYETVAFQGPSQCGKTEVCLNLIGYHIGYAPMPILLVEPTLEMVKRFSRQRLDPMLRDTEVLRGLVRDQRSRDAANTVFCKDFPGGILIMATAGSADNLRSMPTAIVILDEYESENYHAHTSQGSVLGLTQARQRRFPRRKTFVPTTPLREGSSPIESLIASLEESRVWHVPCPRCGTYQELVLEHLRYRMPSGQIPEVVPGVGYECAQCNRLWDAEREQHAILREGQWVRERDEGDLSVGFRLPGLSVSWIPWGRVVSMDLKTRGDAVARQDFVNTVLGLAYTEPREAPPWEPLYERRQEYRVGVVQPGCRFLTMAVDVQQDRLEVEIRGWGRDLRYWSLLYRVLVGDPLADQVWQDLDILLATDWPTAAGDGHLPVLCCAVDSGKYPERVYAWARRHIGPSYAASAVGIRHPRTVMVVKGRDVWGRTLLTAEKVSAEEKKRGLRVVGVGVSGLKRELYQWLRQTVGEDGKEPRGWGHWPAAYDERYFRGLVAERLVVKIIGGRPRDHWELPSGVRNEPLDLHVYNRAAATALGIDRFTDRDWERIEGQVPPSLLQAPVGPGALAPRASPPMPVSAPTSALRPPPAPTPVPTPVPLPSSTPVRSDWMRRFR